MGAIGVGLLLVVDGLSGWPIRDWMISNFILACSRAIEMHIIAGPDVVRVHRGMQGFAVIAESHITVEAKDDGRVYVDVCSCGLFSTEVPVDLAKDYFDLQDGYQSQVVRRAGTAAGVAPSRKA